MMIVNKKLLHFLFTFIREKGKRIDKVKNIFNFMLWAFIARDVTDGASSEMAATHCHLVQPAEEVTWFKDRTKQKMSLTSFLCQKIEKGEERIVP